MILAAADYAEDDRMEPPRELELMFECRLFQGALYAGGGLADQPAGLMRRMRSAWNVWNAVSEWRQARNKAEWCAQNPEDWKIVQMVIKMREEPPSP